MFQNYLKIAWRNLTRHSGFTLINILGLSIGICSALIIYLITSFELSYDRFHPDRERIYRIVGSEQDDHGKASEIGSPMNPMPTTMRKELTGFETVAQFFNYYARVIVPNGNGEPKRFDFVKRGEEASPVIIAGPEYFDIFHYQWLEGSPQESLRDPSKLVLSESEARKYFGPLPLADIVGKTIFYQDIYQDDSLQLTVSGIVKDWDQHTDLVFKDFISFATIDHSFLQKGIQLNHWGNWNPDGQGFVKLAKGVTPARAERQFPQFVQAHLPRSTRTRIHLQPLADLHFNSNYRDDYTRHAHLPTLYALMGIAVFILIIAAINFINLSTAQSLNRSKEIGVRKVLGSSKASLRTQFLVETFVVTLASVILSTLLANPLLKLFNNMVPDGVKLHLSDPATLLFLLSITLVTTLLAGSYPAKVLASLMPVVNLRGHNASNVNQGSFLRKTLIVFQFAISLVFIISTLVIGNQIHFIQNKDLGFAKDAIITVHTAYNQPIDRVGVLAENLRQLAGVERVSTHLETPAAFGHSAAHLARVDDATSGINGAPYEMCDENYISLFGIKIIAGRNLTHSDTVREFLINETCVKALGFKDPEDALGKKLQTGMNDAIGSIVGVVKDFHSRSLHDPISPFYLSSDKHSERAISLKLTANTGANPAGQFNTTLSKIERSWKTLYPNEKFEYSFFDERIGRLYAEEQKTAQLMNTAMIVAIFISCMGLFGLATFTAQQRTREIGIRKVLGASVSGIVSMLSLDFLKPVAVAIVIASPLAWYFMHQWLDNFAYRIAIGPWVFVAAGVCAILIALLTVSFQAIRAAVTNPVKSLKAE